ncbi:MAG: 2,3-bisphosphoglycerate-independent phosphoglycerate mutase [Euryarchaeota archaeon]|nr:2,3-bisphosphoglycerate-independent phosphoglycerate mutase [Euryarchaeota archaeon]
MTPFVLAILDGWGVAPATDGNAIKRARTPNWTRFEDEGLVTEIAASGEAVGLPPGQMGNSEVGHLNIGAGRIVFQDIVRIDRDIREGRFRDNEAFKSVMRRSAESGKTLHLAGLIGPGGVHSHERHMHALLDAAAHHGVKDLQVHAFLDGRDTPPKSAGEYLGRLEEAIRRAGVGRIATVQGRYWAMDRDERWERTERAYRALVHLEGETAKDAREALQQAYGRNENDEFVQPTVIEGAEPVTEGDGFIFVNFRPDRARQMTRALAEPRFDDFPVKDLGLDYVCMTRYQDAFQEFAAIAYPPERPDLTLGEHLSRLGVSQLRIAETEKYAHVTYFFSGGREEPFELEERILVPSPKVATYDLQPEMNAEEVTDRLLERLDAPEPPQFVVLNFAQPDMVGHTGDFTAAVRAVEVTDTCLGRIAAHVRQAGGALLITADHGNVEEMRDEKGDPVTKHTTNPVPLVLVTAPGAIPEDTRFASGGILADVSPTILDLMGLSKPSSMDRSSLFQKGRAAASSDPVLT